MNSQAFDRAAYSHWSRGVAIALALLLIVLWLLGRGPNGADSCCAPVIAAPAAPVVVPTPAPGVASAPAVAIAKPAATLFFDSGKTSPSGDAAALVAPVAAYLKDNALAKAVISGYNDPTGNAAKNAEIAKARAFAVREALKAQGIDDARIDMRKPVDTNLGGNLDQARRVELTVE